MGCNASKKKNSNKLELQEAKSAQNNSTTFNLSPLKSIRGTASMIGRETRLSKIEESSIL